MSTTEVNTKIFEIALFLNETKKANRLSDELCVATKKINERRKEPGYLKEVIKLTREVRETYDKVLQIAEMFPWSCDREDIAQVRKSVIELKECEKKLDMMYILTKLGL